VIRIKNASFLTSTPSIDDSIPNDMSEVAFLGRSNVGKSSFINALTNHKNLAKSSSTPGKTRLINFFGIIFNDEENDFQARFVDLPGFGYAKVSKSMQKEWQKNLTNFIEQRSSIRTFIFLIDARHPSLEIDKEVYTYLQTLCKPDQKILIFFTKADKLKQKDLSVLKKIHPDALLVSNTNKKGIQVAIDTIFNSLFGV
jgi:GTP-binding protein